MTFYVPIAEAHLVDDTLRVVNHPDGWVEGPQIEGKIIPPSSDTSRTIRKYFDRAQSGVHSGCQRHGESQDRAMGQGRRRP